METAELTKPPSKPLTVLVPVPLAEEVGALARENFRSVGAEVRLALGARVARAEKNRERDLAALNPALGRLYPLLRK